MATAIRRIEAVSPQAAASLRNGAVRCGLGALASLADAADVTIKAAAASIVENGKLSASPPRPPRPSPPALTFAQRVLKVETALIDLRDTFRSGLGAEGFKNDWQAACALLRNISDNANSLKNEIREAAEEAGYAVPLKASSAPEPAKAESSKPVEAPPSKPLSLPSKLLKPARPAEAKEAKPVAVAVGKAADVKKPETPPPSSPPPPRGKSTFEMTDEEILAEQERISEGNEIMTREFAEELAVEAGYVKGSPRLCSNAEVAHWAVELGVTRRTVLKWLEDYVTLEV